MDEAVAQLATIGVSLARVLRCAWSLPYVAADIDDGPSIAAALGPASPARDADPVARALATQVGYFERGTELHDDPRSVMVAAERVARVLDRLAEEDDLLTLGALNGEHFRSEVVAGSQSVSVDLPERAHRVYALLLEASLRIYIHLAPRRDGTTEEEVLALLEPFHAISPGLGESPGAEQGAPLPPLEGQFDPFFARNAIAISYVRSGRARDAIPLMEELAADVAAVRGNEHPDAFSARNNLAEAYVTLGRTQDALTLLEQVFTKSSEALGQTHVITLTAGMILAFTYWQAGRSAWAVSLTQQVLPHLVSVLGAKHPWTILVRSNLAHFYQGTDHTQDALALQEQVARDYAETRGYRHPDTLRARDRLSAWQRIGP